MARARKQDAAPRKGKKALENATQNEEVPNDKGGELDEEEDVLAGDREASVPASTVSKRPNRGKVQTRALRSALLEDWLVWDSKPEPFQERYHGHHTHKEWVALEQEARNEMDAARQAATPETSGEIETRRFEFHGKPVYCEKFLRVNFTLEQPFANSRLSAELDDAVAKLHWVLKKPSPEAVQYVTAMSLAEEGKPKCLNGKRMVEKTYSNLTKLEPNWWNDAERKFAILKNKKFVDSNKNDRWYLNQVLANWDKWKVDDRFFVLDRNISTTEGLLRTPPEDALYLALDKSDEMFAFLVPDGLQDAYADDIVERMVTDTDTFYSHLKVPNGKTNQRCLSQGMNLKNNPDLDVLKCGTDHFGHWHCRGDNNGPIYETSDAIECNASRKQLLLQLLHYTGGAMTRVLDFWFGVWNPELRKEYRRVYRDSPQFARLPPVNTGHEETYTLRVIVANRPTDRHVDQYDWQKGITGLCQLGRFEGAAMCFNQLRLRLDGYRNGSILLFKGSHINHYLSPWTGECRYAFDHTTHESVRITVDKKAGKIRVTPTEAPKKTPATRTREKRKVGEDENEEIEDADGEGKNPGPPKKKTKVKAVKGATKERRKRSTTPQTEITNDGDADGETAGDKNTTPPARNTRSQTPPAKTTRAKAAPRGRGTRGRGKGGL